MMVSYLIQLFRLYFRFRCNTLRVILDGVFVRRLLICSW